MSFVSKVLQDCRISSQKESTLARDAGCRTCMQKLARHGGDAELLMKPKMKQQRRWSRAREGAFAYHAAATEWARAYLTPAMTEGKQVSADLVLLAARCWQARTPGP